METEIANTNNNLAGWSPNAPKGGRAVMQRMLKESSTVPLFFGQTLIQSLRDVGYTHTTSALCEHVDNALQAGATEIRVYFRQSGKKGAYRIDVAVQDNGIGMSPNTLKVATAFGGSTSFDDRSGIGRFGMGMKTAALNMSPSLEIYSWQEPGAVYSMTLDVEDVGKDRKNLVELPDPTALSELPDEVSRLMTRKMSYPSRGEDQELYAPQGTDLKLKLGEHGTIVYMPDCDRLTFRKARTLADHAMKDMARIYRRAIASGRRIYVNNRRLSAFDPTFSMSGAWHTRVPDLGVKQSRLVTSRRIQIPVSEDSTETQPLTVKLFRLPIEEWSELSRKVKKNDLKIFDRNTVSILRNDREVFAGTLPKLTGQHSVIHWLRVQIDFPGSLDEAFGVAANKQGVRLKDYVERALIEAIGADVVDVKEDLKRFQAKQAVEKIPSKPSESEQRATESDSRHRSMLGSDLTEEEEGQMEANLRDLAERLKRSNETEEEAYERVLHSKYLLTYKHDPYWPFYHVSHEFGRVILTINSAHPFFSELYEPLKRGRGTAEGEEGHEEGGPVTALELLLLSLARTHSRLSSTSPETKGMLETLQREWSEVYRVQLDG